METTAIDIREKLHYYVDNGDKKLLDMMLAVAKVYTEEVDETDYEFTPEEIKELDKRWEKHLTGESKSYTWQEAKEMITARK